MFGRSCQASRAFRLRGLSRSSRRSPRPASPCGPRPAFARSRKISAEATLPLLVRCWLKQDQAPLFCLNAFSCRKPVPPLSSRQVTGFRSKTLEPEGSRNRPRGIGTSGKSPADISGRLQQRLADKIRGVARAKLAHGFGAMAFESPWADIHPHGTLLVGASFADQAEHLALALGQRLAAGLRQNHHARRATAILAAGLAFPFLVSLGI